MKKPRKSTIGLGIGCACTAIAIGIALAVPQPASVDHYSHIYKKPYEDKIGYVKPDQEIGHPYMYAETLDKYWRWCEEKKAEAEAQAAAEEQARIEAEAAAAAQAQAEYSSSGSGYAGGYSAPSAYQGSSFRSDGVWSDGTYRYTWYSSNVLYHYRTGEWTAGSDGIYRDADGYVVVASSDLPQGSVVEDTPFGAAKVYDSGCASGTLDVYTNF